MSEYVLRAPGSAGRMTPCFFPTAKSSTLKPSEAGRHGGKSRGYAARRAGVWTAARGRRREEQPRADFGNGPLEALNGSDTESGTSAQARLCLNRTINREAERAEQVACPAGATWGSPLSPELPTRSKYNGIAKCDTTMDLTESPKAVNLKNWLHSHGGGFHPSVRLVSDDSGQSPSHPSRSPADKS